MRNESKIKFVGLHAHSVAGSIFDALGYPNEHMDFAYENGCDALMQECIKGMKEKGLSGNREYSDL